MPRRKAQLACNKLDLNPSENVWKLLKDAITHGEILPRNLEDPKIISEWEWRSIGSTKLCVLCHSMLARLQAMIQAKGGHTCW